MCDPFDAAYWVLLARKQNNNESAKCCYGSTHYAVRLHDQGKDCSALTDNWLSRHLSVAELPQLCAYKTIKPVVLFGEEAQAEGLPQVVHVLKAAFLLLRVDEAID